MVDTYQYYFIFSRKNNLLYIGIFEQNNLPIYFKNKTIKILKFKFPKQDEKFTTDLLHKAYQPRYKKIKFSN